MKTGQLLRAVVEREKERDEAWRALDRAVARAFPIGTEVQVYMGRPVIHGRVITTHECTDWSDFEAGYVYIENLNTGKRRKFSAPGAIERGEVTIL